MKKITLLILCSFMAILAQSQNTAINNLTGSTSGMYSEAINTIQNTTPSANIEMFNKYSKISNSYRYGAIGAGSLSAGLFLGFACTKDRYELNKDKKEVMTVKSKSFLLGGCAAFFIAVVCEINAIEYKSKANKHLSLQLTQNGLGLAYSF